MRALGREQPSKHFAASEADAEHQKYKSAKLKGIHSVIHTKHLAEVAKEIYIEIIHTGAIKKLQKLADRIEDEYHRNQALEMRFAKEYDGWEAHEERYGWGDMKAIHIRGCEIDDLKIWVFQDAWGVSFHFIPRRYAKV